MMSSLNYLCMSTVFIILFVARWSVAVEAPDNKPPLTIKLKSVDFCGANHTLYKKDAELSWILDDYADDSEDVPIVVEWEDSNRDGTATDGDGEKNEPVCYTKGCMPKMTAVLFFSYNISPGRSAKLRVMNGATALATNDITLSGTTISEEDIDWGTSVGDLINYELYTLTWEVSLNGGTDYVSIGTSKTRFYVVCSEPTGSVVTAKRIASVVMACDGLDPEGDESGIVDELWKWGPGDEVLNAIYPRHVPEKQWAIMDGEFSSCIENVALFERMLLMLGVNPSTGSITYVYPDPGKGSHESSSPVNSSTRDCSIGASGHTSTAGQSHASLNSKEALGFYTSESPLSDNRYEACYKYNNGSSDQWYAPGVADPFDSVQAVMEGFVFTTFWAVVNQSWDGLFQCITPGPSIEAQW